MKVFRRKRGVEGLDVALGGKKGKTGEGDCQKQNELHPWPPEDLLAQGPKGAAEAPKSWSKASS
jgi:hypothetical protein